jgi:excinuclease UvrABC nuclease subunit
MSNWVAFDFVNSEPNIPDKPGVYAIFGDGILIYIGQSSNVWKRLLSHNLRLTYSSWGGITPWGTFRSIVVKVRRSQREGDWLMIEHRLIKRLQPSMNCRGGPRPHGSVKAQIEASRWRP